MKGVVFAGFLEMLEEHYGYAAVNRVIDHAELTSEGVYSSTGNYPHAELLSMAEVLSREENLSTDEILFRFGRYIFHHFARDHRQWLEQIHHPFDLFEALDGHIHREVRKMYPEAETPSFQVRKREENYLEMLYVSKRRMEFFASGLMESAIEHYGYRAEIHFEEIDPETVRFSVSLHE